MTDEPDRYELMTLMRENERKLGESNAKIAEIRGKADGMILTTLGEDDKLKNLLRAQAWIKHDQTLTITKDSDDNIHGMPDGWPPSIENPLAHVAEYINAKKNGYLAKTFGATKEVIEKTVEDSPSVQRLREAIAS